MDHLEKIREDLDSRLGEAQEWTQRDNFNPDDPGYTALKDGIDVLQRSYETAVEIHNRQASADKVGASIARRERVQVKERQRPDEDLSLGELFLRSAEFSGYMGRGTSQRLVVDQPLLTRAVITTAADPGKAFMIPDRSFVKRVPTYQTPLLDLANPIQVSSGTVEYVDYPAAAPLAAVVAEGALKPEAALSAVTVSKSLENLAHHVVITRQALEDSSQLRSWIDGNLTRGIGDKLEANAAAALVAATLPAVTGGGSLLSAVRVGVGKVQSAGYRPGAVVLNPADAAAIDIAIMGGTLLGPVSSSSVWGVPVIASGAAPVGTAWVGDFTAGLTLFYRSGTEVLISDSHADYFLKNQFVILAERRALAVVTVPEAFAECTAGTTQVAAASAGKK